MDLGCLRWGHTEFDHITQGALVRLWIWTLDGVTAKNDPACAFGDDRLG
jgi:hypothetical protein